MHGSPYRGLSFGGCKRRRDDWECTDVRCVSTGMWGTGNDMSHQGIELQVLHTGNIIIAGNSDGYAIQHRMGHHDDEGWSILFSLIDHPVVVRYKGIWLPDTYGIDTRMTRE